MLFLLKCNMGVISQVSYRCTCICCSGLCIYYIRAITFAEGLTVCLALFSVLGMF